MLTCQGFNNTLLKITASDYCQSILSLNFFTCESLSYLLLAWSNFLFPIRESPARFLVMVVIFSPFSGFGINIKRACFRLEISSPVAIRVSLVSLNLSTLEINMNRAHYSILYL